VRRRGPLAAFFVLGVFWGGWAALVPAIQTAVGASKGELGLTLLFVAVGSVDALVDFGQVGKGGVQVSDDRRAATITLPRPRLSDPEIDVGRSYVYDQDRGLFNQIGSLFGNDTDSQREVYLLAEQKIRAAAQNGSGLVPRAEDNTRKMLQTLLRSLGFTRVAVNFEPK